MACRHLKNSLFFRSFCHRCERNKSFVDYISLAGLAEICDIPVLFIPTTTKKSLFFSIPKDKNCNNFSRERKLVLFYVTLRKLLHKHWNISMERRLNNNKKSNAVVVYDLTRESADGFFLKTTCTQRNLL